MNIPHEDWRLAWCHLPEQHVVFEGGWWRADTLLSCTWPVVVWSLVPPQCQRPTNQLPRSHAHHLIQSQCRGQLPDPWWFMITAQIAWPRAGDGAFKFHPSHLWLTKQGSQGTMLCLVEVFQRMTTLVVCSTTLHPKTTQVYVGTVSHMHHIHGHSNPRCLPCSYKVLIPLWVQHTSNQDGTNKRPGQIREGPQNNSTQPPSD